MPVEQRAVRYAAVVSLVALGGLGCESGAGAGGAAPESMQGPSAAAPGAGESPADGSSGPAGDGPEGDGPEGGSASSPMTGTMEGPSAGVGTEDVSTLNGGMLPTDNAGTPAMGNGDMAASAAGEEAGGADDTGGGGTATGPTFHVFLLLGQSNMAGYPKAQQADRVEDPRVRVLGFDDCAATGRQTDVWDVAAPPLHECWNDGLGPGDYFARTLVGMIPDGDTIGLVPSAISGERIEPFLKIGGTRYDRLLQRARLAQEAGGRIEGILFHQGESNSGDPTWPEKVSTLVTDLRVDLGLGEVPFLAGELLYSGGAAGHNRLVNLLPGLVSNAFVVSASGLVVDPADTQWNLHFDRDSQVEFGKRYAQQMIQALGW